VGLPVVTPAPSPAQAAARTEIRRTVERVVDALRTSCRLTFVMHTLEHMSIEETGCALRIPEAIVKTHLHGADRQLRETLGNELGAALEGVFPFGGVRCEHLTEAVIKRLAVMAAATQDCARSTMGRVP
jgi:RNA polymerase sigma-70 factor, ECF subfamily